MQYILAIYPSKYPHDVQSILQRIQITSALTKVYNCLFMSILSLRTKELSLIASFMGPTWGPSEADRTQMTPWWPHELCYIGFHWQYRVSIEDLINYVFVKFVISCLIIFQLYMYKSKNSGISSMFDLYCVFFNVMCWCNMQWELKANKSQYKRIIYPVSAMKFYKNITYT